MESSLIPLWPVPDSYTKRVPLLSDAAFGAPREYDKGIGRHAGIDIYAPVGSKVVSSEAGKVVHVGIFTGPPENPQWRATWYVMIEHRDGRVAVYGEIRKPKLRTGQRVRRGQIVGYIAKVIFGKKTRVSAMLHFELHKKGSRISVDWIGKRPQRFIDPTHYLRLARS